MNTEDETPKLPDLQQADLDEETLDRYFLDLQECAEVFAVIPKKGPGYVAPTAVELREGKSLLRSGQARGLQIRYGYQGAEWWDTLIVREGGVRMTRIEQNFS
ncbi:hypothetical protein IEN85_15225 [Pelagicoccus sp. NFK12]|uniref:Uncharacterized protein n=1 Tax=Pelagicoccus enzymogenes TaxID=2773457 RepID=A0A927F9L2_9BACT|nr:hypothetical protein [Pelagicoccus enzymogenes]MBD5780849.1 hypothetical protein [Pelagicoccus enzymogenes]